MNMKRIISIFVWIVTSGTASAISSEQETQLSGDALTRQLLARVNIIEARDRSQQHQIDALKLELANQKQEMTRMRRQIIEKDLQVSKLTQICSQKVTNKPDYHQNSVSNSSKLSRIHQENRIRRAGDGVHVAFTAGLSHSILHAGEHQNIVFDHVETNVGNAYNPHHGVFLAPVTGTYLFYTSVMAESNREIWCQIVVNGVKKVTAYARGTDARFDQGSQAVIVHLQKGDDVAVQNYLADDGIFSNPDIWTSFSGLLLYQG
ncbi:heavy metal-binding protein HIP-like [Mercenaria mercenaria]|uniref:heavy metal-binding protein HIP-like n=1 Tax=Mercenaria mercenaria TaxID=6596 RepID=UPI00234EAF8D|nr:heavy metal-binding protein HIP-like [Mercenaria mercenaria]